ncbi:hypothetical protein ACMU_08560 [Actibacterium mucosum KCTC 23349]|uniref:(2Fe-2S) ferredoxin domain-containing protein n=1 Tax=Actibacterium mucosum KCTC 23349 TaxID=1454373 RepID=A0A037ZLW1_9RHOB|nr:(2Fe-2S) ferredoxin domain-containing protein [Actibacterium mucosum]KAJ55816.1 hypothetical protein ACMU_08560 [Actibacterium mucosum KCTC 23349]
MDAYIYLISATYVSQSRFLQLAKALEGAAPVPAKAVRLEATGNAMWRVLDTFTAQGAQRIELRPVGLPFSQSLEKWLPGAAGSWLCQQGPNAPALFLAGPADLDHLVVQSAATAQVPLTPVHPQPHGEIGKGWDHPPAFRHHLLVCAGPRCHLKDAPNLVDALKAELGRANLGADCLITTTGCLFPCNNGPVIVHYPQGHWYRLTDTNDIRTFVAQALRGGRTPQNLLIHKTGETHETV